MMDSIPEKDAKHTVYFFCEILYNRKINHKLAEYAVFM
mgnify:CR=1 FL=1